MRPPRGTPATALLAASRIALLAGPFVLAFAAGGYFDDGRLWALMVVFVVLAAGLVAGAPPLPRTGHGLLAVAGMAAFAGWTALSATWAPLGGQAADDTQRVVLYAGALVGAVALLGPRGVARAAEPALAAGIAIVVGYGLAGRLLPGIVHESVSGTAAGRLDQPLTYWNAMGAMAAVGIVLCTRLAGDGDRPRAMRAAAAAAVVPLGMGLFLTYSRASIAAAAGGLIALAALAPTRAQWRAGGLCVVAALAGAATAAVSGPVRDLSGSLSSRETAGAAVLVVGVAVAVAVAAVATWIAALQSSGRLSCASISLPRRSSAIAVLAVIAVVAVPVLVARGSASPAPGYGETGSRLTSVGSNRYSYWKVAVRTGAHHPIAGVGTGGFGVEWLIHRDVADTAHDAHSLELETFAELGLVGVALLAALLAGVGLSARAAHRTDGALAAGPIAALIVWALHSALDWDWEMPALTLVAIVLAGLLVARAQAPPAP